MSSDPSRLQVEFSTEAAFRSEYASNIANGGVFIATRQPLDVRTTVIVVLDLSFCGQVIELEGEVVHCIPPEMADAGASPGVAVQFTLPARELRKQFEPFAGPIEGNERLTRSGRRAAPRSPARLRVTVRSESLGEFECRTRDISSSGVLLSIATERVPVGERVQLTIFHPTCSEAMDVDGTVVRHLITNESEVTALGVEFHVPEARQTEVTAFMSEVQSAEHSRRLGGITGPIAELGIENLLQMFGSSSPQGTLTVSRDVLEGMIVFEGGNLVGARIGTLTSTLALREMLSWREGSFEFQARVDESDFEGEPVPLSGAILDALCRMDEQARGPTGPKGDALDIDIDIEAELGLDLDDEALDLEDPVVVESEAPSPAPADDSDLDSAMRKPARSKRGRRSASRQKARAGKPAKSSKPAKPGSSDREGHSSGPVRIGPKTTFVVNVAAADSARSELAKTEEAVLDLVLVGMSVGRIVDVIPEPELEVYGAIDSLIERGLVTCS